MPKKPQPQAQRSESELRSFSRLGILTLAFLREEARLDCREGAAKKGRLHPYPIRAAEAYRKNCAHRGLSSNGTENHHRPIFSRLCRFPVPLPKSPPVIRQNDRNAHKIPQLVRPKDKAHVDERLSALLAHFAECHRLTLHYHCRSRKN
jgi:hypothetical protein